MALLWEQDEAVDYSDTLKPRGVHTIEELLSIKLFRLFTPVFEAESQHENIICHHVDYHSFVVANFVFHINDSLVLVVWLEHSSHALHLNVQRSLKLVVIIVRIFCVKLCRFHQLPLLHPISGVILNIIRLRVFVEKVPNLCVHTVDLGRDHEGCTLLHWWNCLDDAFLNYLLRLVFFYFFELENFISGQFRVEHHRVSFLLLLLFRLIYRIVSPAIITHQVFIFNHHLSPWVALLIKDSIVFVFFIKGIETLFLLSVPHLSDIHVLL